MIPIYKLLALCVLPLVASDCSNPAARAFFKRSVYEFSADLLRRIAVDNEGHFVTSTLSPYTMLSTISLGAADETLKQIKHVLHQQDHVCYTNKFLRFAKQIFTADDSATLERSGVLFVDDTVSLYQAFKNKVTRYSVCEITSLPFDDTAVAAAHINDFVKSATHGVIDEIVNPDELDGVYLMLVEALYFKGAWRIAFTEENTQASQFYDSDGNLLGDVNLMYLSDELNVTRLPPIHASVLELPYGKTDRFSMLVFLPDDGVHLYTMIDKLKKVSLQSVFGQFERQGPQTVIVQIPRFKISSDFDNLKELLIDMGIRDMFDQSKAKFPDLMEYQLHVSSFVQKADIEVTEEGTVAAAATSLGFSYRSSMDLEFIANKPFLFMIVDRKAQVAVFTGAYSKPSLF